MLVYAWFSRHVISFEHYTSSVGWTGQRLSFAFHSSGY